MANSKCRWEAPKQWDEWSQWLAAGLHARNRWRLPERLLLVIDDSPTKRYGKTVEGADVHHNPTPSREAANGARCGNYRLR